MCHYQNGHGGRGGVRPWHLGELTRIVPFEMVDAALDATATLRRRVRVLPAGVVVYLLLAGCLFAGAGYRQVWHKLTVNLGGPGGLVVADPSENALWQARVRLGVAPLRALFDLLRDGGRYGALVRAAGVRDRRDHHGHPGGGQKPWRVSQADR